MATQTRDQLLHFRASGDLAAAAAASAQRDGVSLSEFMRRALEREISAAPPRSNQPATLSIDDMVDLAGRGDHDAQFALSEHYRNKPGNITPDLSTGLAVVYGQMAAQSGNVFHVLQWATALITRGEYISEGECSDQADAIAYLSSRALAAIEVCADAGHAPSQFVAVEIASRVLPEHIAVARALKPTIRVNPLREGEDGADTDLLPLANVLALIERVS